MKLGQDKKEKENKSKHKVILIKNIFQKTSGDARPTAISLARSCRNL